MSRSFDISTESVASVGQLHAAFSREDYWLARLAGDGSATLDSLVVGDDGTVAVHATQNLGRQMLPEVVAKILPGDLKLSYRETWRAMSDGRVQGKIIASAAGGLGSSRADTWLTPAGTGSHLRSAVKVEVKIPLVGGQLEKAIGASLAENIPGVLRFTTTWIAEQV